MNTMKTVVVTVLLMAIGYGVYVSLWQKTEQNGEKASGTPALPTVQIPGQSASSFPGTTGPSGAFSTPSPGSLAPQASLFGSSSPGGNSPIGALPQPNSKPSNGGVTLIAGPNDAHPPAVSTIPPLGSPASDLPAAQTSPLPTANLPAAASGGDLFLDKYKSFIAQVEKTLDDGRLPEALQALTSFYELPNLPEPQRREVEQLLDQLAGTVIYSKLHYLERPYTVVQGDTFDQIAERCNVPALLLARINGIDPAAQLPPGQQIKVLRGPFSAVVSLDRHELMLKLEGGYYAGRFRIGIGIDSPKLEGSYTVLEKTPRPMYRGPNGVSFAAEDERNPLGKYWIGLSDRIGLHGTIDESGIGRDDNRGTICLKDRDIDDLFGILSVGSQVVIRR